VAILRFARTAAPARLPRSGDPFQSEPTRRYARRVRTSRFPAVKRSRALLLALSLSLTSALGTAFVPVAGAAGAAKTTTAPTPALKGGASPLTEATTPTSPAATPTISTTPTTETATKTAVTNSKSTIFIAGGAALALLCGIAYVIVRDARKMAPADVVDEDLLDARMLQERANVVRKRRAKAKAARQQRKRTRSR
jgi:hypothetical protein